MDISIIIPSYNRCHELRRCLTSTEKQQNCSLEVIVVDDCSADSTAEMVRKEFPKVLFLQNETNFGPGYSRNVGLVKATGDYVLFLDSDTELPHASILANFLDFFRNHPDAGCVGGEIRALSQSTDRVYGRKITNDGNSMSISISSEMGYFAKCDFLASCCCMVKRGLAIKIGGFDPYYGFGGEDKDFGYRIKQAGYVNYVSSDCAANHLHNPDARGANETYKYQKTRMRFILKCFPMGKVFYAFTLWLWTAILFYLLLPFKIVFYISKSNPLKKENLLGGFMIIRAFVENINSLENIKSSRSKYFLDKEEMERYVRYCEK